DPEPGHQAVDLELDGGPRAVAGEVAEDQIDVLDPAQAIVHGGDRRLFLRVKLARRAKLSKARASRGHGEGARHLEVVRFLRGREPVEAHAITGELDGLALLQAG